MSLDNAYLFQGMSGETRMKILETAVEESYARGDFLFHQGDQAGHFYVLMEGRVRISVGAQNLLAHVASDPGDVIGWSSLMENNSYTATAECLGPVKVLKIANVQLDQILQADPASGMIFFRQLAVLVGRRLVKCYNATLSLHGEREPHSYG